MIRRTLRGGLWLGLLVGLVLVVAKLLRTRSSSATIDLGSSGGSPGPTPEVWPPLQTPPETNRSTLSRPSGAEKPAGPQPAESRPVEKKTLPPWVAPAGGICPKTHPVKAKLSSGIFQVEGNAMYQRTNADRCYQTPEAAVADGLRPAKR